MKINMRATRRFGGGIALACAAILIPAVALAAPAVPGARSAAAAAARGTAAAPSCHHASTQVWIGLPGDGSAGHVVYQLEFSNIGHHTCTLFGFPGVSAITINGHQVGLAASHSGTRRTVTLRPGATAHAVLTVTDAGAVCAHPVTAAVLRVFPPGQTRAQDAELSVQACPHRRTLNVKAIRAGAGIPGYTIR